ncbi:hypothetical protein [Aeromicrobium stalagmiti]|uniref:hypothetical protein n=1 Tax=Aeromicrobium stalagmiti TaxID=2738988 RepID=UPI0015688EB8|nr:hypothetical protein [Aeromicrobium stalagmiti]NRQ48401.1 hypothetical protein [Aeromicrobium stalagmiti]
MASDDAGRPGDAELTIAVRAGLVAVVGWFFADLVSGLTSPTGLSLTFLLWLLTFLAAARALLAVSIGLWRRSHG